MNTAELAILVLLVPLSAYLLFGLLRTMGCNELATLCCATARRRRRRCIVSVSASSDVAVV